MKQTQCRIRLNKKDKNDKRRVKGSCVTFVSFQTDKFSFQTDSFQTLSLHVWYANHYWMHHCSFQHPCLGGTEVSIPPKPMMHFPSVSVSSLLPQNWYISPLLHEGINFISPLLFQFSHYFLSIFVFSPILTMMHVCIIQYMYWTPLRWYAIFNVHRTLHRVTF